MQQIIPMSITKPLTYNFDFNTIQYKVFSELVNATNIIKVPKCKIITSEIQCLTEASRLMTWSLEQEIKKLLVFCKHLPQFKSLCDHDQLALFKYGCIEVINMRAVVFFNQQGNYWNLFMV